jgi:2-dehydropantoate 2-reductase
MWHKWVFISTVGALTCLTRGTVGDIVAAPEGEKLGPAILAEAAAVSAAAGYPVPQTELDGTTHTITEPTSAFASSMFRDVSDRHHTEVEHILADLAARARTFQVSTPLLDLATLHLRVYEDRLAKDTHP